MRRDGILKVVNSDYDFLKVDYENPNLRNDLEEKDKKCTLKRRSNKFYAILPAVLFTPTHAFAASDTFIRIRDMFMTGADYLFTFVVIFAGASWMLGNRSKAIELIICAASGWLIISHADDLLAILKSI